MMEEIHDRMPVILREQDYDRWIDPEEKDSKELQDLLVPYPASEMFAHQVSTHVNSPNNDDPRCVEPAPLDDPKEGGASPVSTSEQDGESQLSLDL